MTTLGFKQVTAANLLEPDPVALSFANALDVETGEWKELSLDEYVGFILEPTLSDAVPQEVREVFEAGRSAMGYGYFFYPLFMMGFQQACLVVDTALECRARQLGGTARATPNERIDFLAEKGVLSDVARQQWHGIRKMRNLAVHPSMREIMPPGPSLSGLAAIAMAVNELFA